MQRIAARLALVGAADHRLRDPVEKAERLEVVGTVVDLEVDMMKLSSAVRPTLRLELGDHRTERLLGLAEDQHRGMRRLLAPPPVDDRVVVAVAEDTIAARPGHALDEGGRESREALLGQPQRAEAFIG